MKSLILKLVKNGDNLSSALGDIDPLELERGVLTVGKSFVASLLGLLEDEKIKVTDVEIGADGITASVIYDRMTLDYYMQVKNLSISGGRLNGEIYYREKRQGGGIGNALLGISGKNGISVALGRKRWCRVDNDTILLDSVGMPDRFYLRYTGIKQGRLTFKIN
ncbi:MAG: hypothetical protein IKM04_06795 [Clostridia bacterium]|nr:hypothetical protein [Clostridia bacterium]